MFDSPLDGSDWNVKWLLWMWTRVVINSVVISARKL